MRTQIQIKLLGHQNLQNKAAHPKVIFPSPILTTIIIIKSGIFVDFLKLNYFIFIRYVEICHCIFLQFLISFIFRDFQSVNKYDQPNSKLNSEKENLQDWILIVKHVVARDSGKYECQVWFMHFFFVSKIIYANIIQIPDV